MTENTKGNSALSGGESGVKGQASASGSERWLRQTKRGGWDVPADERGDCLPACIASLLGVPLEAIANHHGEDWWERYQSDLGEYGYGIAELDIRYDPPWGYWIASVPSLNLQPMADNGKEQWHTIVCRGLSFVHEPGMGEQLYDAERWVEAWNGDLVKSGCVLVPLDPASAPMSKQPFRRRLHAIPAEAPDSGAKAPKQEQS